MPLSIKPIDAFNDNYLWLICNEDTKQAVVVDPGDAEPVSTKLNELGLQLKAIFITHHHSDHIGGVNELVQLTGANVYGPQSRYIPEVTHPVFHGDDIQLLGVSFKVLEIPGHTLDHIAYFSGSIASAPRLFCGDTLFAGGCGRVFEGTPEQMVNSLNKLAQLPANTVIYCAHEYTQNNLRFAQAIEPSNSRLKARVKNVNKQRQLNVPTVPSLLSEELETNPFLRCHLPAIQSVVSDYKKENLDTELSTFTALRAWKDTF